MWTDGCQSSGRAIYSECPRPRSKIDCSGRVEHGSASGPAAYLNKFKKELVEFLLEMSKIEYGKTNKEVICIVRRTIEKKDLNVKGFNG